MLGFYCAWYILILVTILLFLLMGFLLLFLYLPLWHLPELPPNLPLEYYAGLTVFLTAACNTFDSSPDLVISVPAFHTYNKAGVLEIHHWLQIFLLSVYKSRWPVDYVHGSDKVSWLQLLSNVCFQRLHVRHCIIQQLVVNTTLAMCKKLWAWYI